MLKQLPGPKFSIIVPAHNSEKFISKALMSIQEQTFTDYELIVVCDHCTDKTADIARIFTPRVYEVDYNRDGLSRNFGLDRAIGDWILFMDDDDWFLHEYVLSLLDYILKSNSPDILAFSFIWKGVGYARNTPDHLYIATWNKCWKRKAIGNTRFSDKEMSSDEDFHNAMLAKRPRIMCWDMPLYYYNYMRPGSQTEIAKNTRV
jgi:glycosyltransferase involved in cell wall biosynthesis